MATTITPTQSAYRIGNAVTVAISDGFTEGHSIDLQLYDGVDFSAVIDTQIADAGGGVTWHIAFPTYTTGPGMIFAMTSQEDFTQFTSNSFTLLPRIAGALNRAFGFGF